MAYIGRGLDNGVRNQFIFAATQGQTAFTGADSGGKTLAISDLLYTDCYQNGVKLKPTTDYTVSLTTLTLVSAASLNDVVDIVAFDIFGVPDTVPASTGGTFNGAISATSYGAVSGTTGTFSGNVGIGLTSPQELLHIKDGDIAVGNGTAGNNAVIGRVGFSTDSSNSRFIGMESFRGSDAAHGDLRFHTFNGDGDKGERLRITDDGRGLSQFTAKAWVNFNGTGTLAIRDSHNVSSVTDNGTGDYTVNWDVDMANANYCMSGMASHSDVNSNFINVVGLKGTDTVVAASCRLITSYRGQTDQQRYDSLIVTLMAFGD